VIAAVVPTLDEEDAIGAVLDAMPSSIAGEPVEVFVIDGGSTDDTMEIARAHGATVMEQSYPGAKGAAVREAIEEIDAAVYVFLDGDGTYDPAGMPRLVLPVLRGEADHVIGTRFKGREPGALSRFNLVGNIVFNRLTSLLTGYQVQDMLSGYRALGSEHARSMTMQEDGFGIETELTFRTLNSRARLVQTPITYSRREGSSKLRPVRDGARILATILTMAARTHPRRTAAFLGGSLVLVLAAVIGAGLLV